MPAGKPARKQPVRVTYDEVADALIRAIRKREDFVLAWERDDIYDGQESSLLVHVMTGNLVTPCRLNGITGRALLYGDEGARIITGTWQDGSSCTRQP